MGDFHIVNKERKPHATKVDKKDRERGSPGFLTVKALFEGRGEVQIIAGSLQLT